MNTTTEPIETVTISMDRVFDAAPQRIWRIFTDPDEVAVWGCGDWYDHIAIDLDLRVGGVIHHRVATRDGGVPWTFHGVYHEIIEGERLVYSFDWKTDWRQAPMPSMVAIDISPAPAGKTTVHLAHSGMAKPGAESTDAHWNHFLDKLESLL